MHFEGKLSFCDNCDEMKEELIKRNELWVNSKRDWMDFNNSMDTIIITCIDSRVPVEKIFNLNPGEVLIIRNAGNIITEDVFRSVLAGIIEIHAKNIIVMGHTRCGMSIKDNKSKVNELFKHAPPKLIEYLNLKDIEEIIQWFGFFDAGKWNENAKRQAELLRHKLNEIFDKKNVPKVFDAIYDLDTGKVKFI